LGVLRRSLIPVDGFPVALVNGIDFEKKVGIITPPWKEFSKLK
jgi:hypothetical protein